MFKGLFIVNLLSQWGPLVNSELGWGPGSVEPVEPAVATPLAGVYSEVAAYEFTTLTTVPGVIRYKGAKIQVWLGFIIFKYSLSFFLPPHSLYPFPSLLPLLSQLLDLPGIIGAKDGKGHGRQVIVIARTCSLIYIVLDVLKPLGHKRLLEKELEGFGIKYWWYPLKLKIPFRLRPL